MVRVFETFPTLLYLCGLFKNEKLILCVANDDDVLMYANSYQVDNKNTRTLCELKWNSLQFMRSPNVSFKNHFSVVVVSFVWLHQMLECVIFETCWFIFHIVEHFTQFNSIVDDVSTFYILRTHNLKLSQWFQLYFFADSMGLFIL